MIDKVALIDQLTAIMKANRETLEAVEAIAKALEDEIPELRRKRMRVVGADDA